MIPSLKPAELQTQPINPSRVMRDVTRLLVETVFQSGEAPPDLELGEEVIAKLIQHQGNNRFSALIKDQALTLDFPEHQKPQGDSIKLRVQSLEPKIMFALVDGLGENQKKDAAIRVLLSATSRYLNDLLLLGKNASLIPSPALLNDPEATFDSKFLSQALRQLVQQNGTHYEASLKAWFEGKKSLQDLSMQPQMLLASRLSRQAAANNPEDARLAMVQLGGILQRQMDILQHKALFLNLMPWPNQSMELRIEEDESQRDQQKDESNEVRPWLSRMRLELPYLGTLAVSIRYWQGRADVQFLVEDIATIDQIKANKKMLSDRFSSAGLPLRQIGIDHA